MRLDEIAREPLIVSMLRKLLAAGEEVGTTWVSNSGTEREADVIGVSSNGRELELAVRLTVFNSEIEDTVYFNVDDENLKLKKVKRGWWIDDTWGSHEAQ